MSPRSLSTKISISPAWGRVHEVDGTCYLLLMRILIPTTLLLICAIAFPSAPTSPKKHAQQKPPQPSASAKSAPTIPVLAQLKTMSARFAPSPLRVDISTLSAGDQKALEKLIAAARIVNIIFIQ